MRQLTLRKTLGIAMAVSATVCASIGPALARSTIQPASCQYAKAEVITLQGKEAAFGFGGADKAVKITAGPGRAAVCYRIDDNGKPAYWTSLEIRTNIDDRTAKFVYLEINEFRNGFYVPMKDMKLSKPDATGWRTLSVRAEHLAPLERDGKKRFDGIDKTYITSLWLITTGNSDFKVGDTVLYRFNAPADRPSTVIPDDFGCEF